MRTSRSSASPFGRGGPKEIRPDIHQFSSGSECGCVEADATDGAGLAHLSPDSGDACRTGAAMQSEDTRVVELLRGVLERNRNRCPLKGYVEGCRSLSVASTGELWLRGTSIPIPFYRTAMHKPARYIDQKLERWARRKYKTLLRRRVDRLRRMKSESPRLFFHWSVVGTKVG